MTEQSMKRTPIPACHQQFHADCARDDQAAVQALMRDCGLSVTTARKIIQERYPLMRILADHDAARKASHNALIRAMREQGIDFSS